MGNYELIQDVLHYTGDGWKVTKLTPTQVKQFKANTLDVLKLKWR